MEIYIHGKTLCKSHQIEINQIKNFSNEAKIAGAMYGNSCFYPFNMTYTSILQTLYKYNTLP